jgi:hypothetical protein
MGRRESRCARLTTAWGTVSDDVQGVGWGAGSHDVPGGLRHGAQGVMMYREWDGAREVMMYQADYGMGQREC